MRAPTAFTLLLFLVLPLVQAGCATRIYPPANPPRPTVVYVCDYGVHSSLLLPCGGGQFVEYVYGDWDFAALNKTDPWHTLMALFDSPQAALGRRFLRPDPQRHAPVPPNHPRRMQALLADAGKVQHIVETLDKRYRQQIDTAWFNDEPDYDFLFVKDPQHYGLFNNCNTLTGRELREMGCIVSGKAVLSRFYVMPPQLEEPEMAEQASTPVTLDAAAHE